MNKPPKAETLKWQRRKFWKSMLQTGLVITAASTAITEQVRAESRGRETNNVNTKSLPYAGGISASNASVLPQKRTSTYPSTMRFIAMGQSSQGKPVSTRNATLRSILRVQDPSNSPSTSSDEDLLLAPNPAASPKTTEDSSRKTSEANLIPEATSIPDQDDLLTTPVKPERSSRVPSPSDRPLTLEPSPTINLNQEPNARDRIAPYPQPNFKSPSERVVPLPVVPAPDSFPGFTNTQDSDPQLPEPRRIFELPKPQPSLDPSRTQPLLELAPDYDQSIPNSYSDDTRFRSLTSSMGGQGTISLTNGPTIIGQYHQPTKQNHNRVAQSWNGSTSMSAPVNDGFTTYAPRIVNETAIDGCTKVGQRLSSLSHIDGEPLMGCQTTAVPYDANDFCPTPIQAKPLDPCREIETYYGKSNVDVQRPWVEWWRPFYTGGMYAPGIPVFSDSNLLQPSFLVYGDYRTGVGVHRVNNGSHVRDWAHRLNLDFDLRLTGTERFHMFTGPLDHNGKFTRLDFSDGNAKFIEELDFQPDTAFFEGDLGAITGGWYGVNAPYDLPFTCGLVPLLYQNGIWMEDAIAGFALGRPWRHDRDLNWANYEMTFFAGFNQVTTPAFNNDNNAGQVYGTAWFIEAYEGYIETDYAFLNDLDGLGRSYHNAAIAYTRRYFGRISNSIRLIGNAGQSGDRVNRTADGGLLLIENSLISSKPSNFVPYFNFFLGYGTPQSVARAGGAGGILRNTGILFEGDGLTGYPTLDATGSNAYGGAVGVNILSADFREQLVLEFASQDTYGDPRLSKAPGAEYGIGARWQKALNNRFIWRMDVMNGWIDNASDIYGTRTEFRWKF